MIPREVPLQWAIYVDQTHPSVVALGAWIESLVPFNQEWVLGQIDGLLETAAEGGIVDEGEVRLKPVRADPEMYELRWTLMDKKIRQYHGEPARHPDLLVSLHQHIKDVSGDDGAISQQQEILFAHERYRRPAPDLGV